MKKRGLSAVVTTLIIILLAIVSIGVVWVVVRNVLQEGSEEISLGQFVYDLSIKSASVEGTSVNVNVRRSPGGRDLVGIKFIFYNGSDSSVLEKKVPLSELEEKIFSFSSAEVGDFNSLIEVSIAPIYLSSGNEKTGEITDTANIAGSGAGGTNGGTNGGTGSGTCGDGVVEGVELCDGDNLNSQTCESLGLGTGNLNCINCQFDTSQCSGGTPGSCEGNWIPPEDAGVVCDGEPHCIASSCICEVGFIADGIGGCNLNPPINTGTVFSVWPLGAVKYFDSADLPQDLAGYTAYSINFTGSSEPDCFGINYAEYLSTNGRSYLRLDTTDINPANIIVGDPYFVWEAANCGL